jgi:hypothetical protein
VDEHWGWEGWQAGEGTEGAEGAEGVLGVGVWGVDRREMKIIALTSVLLTKKVMHSRLAQLSAGDGGRE